MIYSFFIITLFANSANSCFSSRLFSELMPKLQKTATHEVGSRTNHQMSIIELRAAKPGFSEKIVEVLTGKLDLKNRTYTKNGKIFNTDVSDICFRGQRDASRLLESALMREIKEAKKKGQKVDKVAQLLAAYIPHDVVLDKKDPISQLSYLQHYGISTPLLDWTKNIEMAFYYAMWKYDRSREHKDTDQMQTELAEGKASAALFMLDPYGLNEIHRLSTCAGIKVGGLALPENFDAVVRAKYPLTHSLFELSCDHHVRRAAVKDGLRISGTIEDHLHVSCAREMVGEKQMQQFVQETLPGPVAVIPKWTENNDRVRALQSIFTVDGIPKQAESGTFGTASDTFYEPHVLKIEFDSSCIKDIVRTFRGSATWALVKSLEDTDNEREFKERQADFARMTEGGFH